MDWMTIIALVLAVAAAAGVLAAWSAFDLYVKERNEFDTYREAAEAEQKESKIMSAAVRCQAQIDKQRAHDLGEALSWYANPANWQGRDREHSVAFKDRGKIAREALGVGDV